MAEGIAPVTLEEYVTAKGDDALALVAASTAEATAMVNRHIGGSANPHEVPSEILARAILEVGADLYYRKAARNGVVTFGNGLEAANVVRINRDPMTQAYPILAPFLPMGFA